MKVDIKANTIGKNYVVKKMTIKNVKKLYGVNPDSIDHRIKVFLASSKELEEDRRAFETILARLNDDFIKQHIYIELVIWEKFLDTVALGGLQKEYNKAIRKCDIFVMLFSTKVGEYTLEEFEVAFSNFKKKGKPLIFVYSREISSKLESADKYFKSAELFKERLGSIGHYYTSYKNTENLLFHFSNQLKKIELHKLSQKK
ncbi:hypothetical protein [Flagellimonas algicola]|uniref:TIR domain-containing protein n=1 Tax=Flagellimonas algicola TaxID=2583815 RepID=A0ABY2WR35_9FLAO|nr:hypothetical protein [Allomuricauda algicola]TMU57464.1 hypothetical protein FGG15_07950 [Allomuricauda algicola]